MLSRTEFAVTRRGMPGPKIAARLRSTRDCYPSPQEGLGNERCDGDPTMVAGLRPSAQHVSSRCRRPIVRSRLIFPAQPDA